jgi:hypothetical protein
LQLINNCIIRGKKSDEDSSSSNKKAKDDIYYNPAHDYMTTPSICDDESLDSRYQFYSPIRSEKIEINRNLTLEDFKEEGTPSPENKFIRNFDMTDNPSFISSSSDSLYSICPSELSSTKENLVVDSFLSYQAPLDHY